MDPLIKRFIEALKEDGISLPFHVAKEYLDFMNELHGSAEVVPDRLYMAILTDVTEGFLRDIRLNKIDAHGLVMSYLRAMSNIN